ncbi:helix-turn-helix transcriptional regulator [Streptomyces sp. NBC_01324]|nr:helix-turn-helix transcriptional regulator [Streptomyces sp. NBC_01324]
MPHQDHPPWLLAHRRVLGDRIRERRMRCNLTQEQLAYRAGISRDTVHRIEAARNDAPISYFWRIARALDMPLADLVRE